MQGTRIQPQSKKIPHASEKLSLGAIKAHAPELWSQRAATIEPMCSIYWNLCTLELVLPNKGRHYNEKPTHLEKAHM